MKDRPSFGVIGYGAIGRVLVAELAKAHDGPAIPLLVKPEYLDEISSEAPDNVQLCAGLDAFIACAPKTVIEAAGAKAVSDLAQSILGAGADLVVASASALTDGDLYQRIETAADANRRQVIVPSGALGSLDVLGAMAAAGLDSVAYRGVKPPAAWRGSPAEELCDLEGMTRETAFFEGSARDAARRFPKNANVAALVGLAGIGLDETRVELVADPAASVNRHELRARGATGEMRFEVSGVASRANARTSATTAYSLLEAARSRYGPIIVGTTRAL